MLNTISYSLYLERIHKWFYSWIEGNHLSLDRMNMSLTDILSAEAIDNAIKDCEGELNQN